MSGFENLQLRKGTAAEWASANPILLAGEPAFSTDTGQLRIGNGTDHWADLTGIGISDHGALSGLADDDHPQYLTAAEGNAAYDAINAASSAVSTHAGLADPHTGYRLEADNHSHESSGAQGGTLDEDAVVLTDVTTMNASTSKHGYMPKGSGVAGKFFNSSNAESIPSTGRYGTGADGAATLDGTAQVIWATLSGSTYTMLRDVNLTSLTINSGITLRPLGCIIWVSGTLDNSGTISWVGNAASANTAGTSEASVMRSLATLAGGAGLVNTASGGNVGTGHGSNKGLSPGKGGAGGPSNTGRNGGLGGVLDPSTFNGVGPRQWDYPSGYTLFNGTGMAGTPVAPQSGTGGGGGAGAASGTSGGGGAGGGVLFILARTLVNQASGVISAKGGAGGNASGTGPCGGGGGGGGGVIYLTTDSYTNSGTITVAGGAGGTSIGAVDLTSSPTPGTDQVVASDTDAAWYSANLGIGTQGTIEFLTVVNTKSGGGDIPSSVFRQGGNQYPDEYAAENSTYTQLATVRNGDQRMTLYWTRNPTNPSDAPVTSVFVGFPATQTSCSIRRTAWAGGNMTSDLTIQEVVTGTATTANTLSIPLTAPVVGGYEIVWTAIQSNNTITKEAAWSGNFAAGAHSAPAGNNRGAYFRGGTDTTAAMTTSGNETWVGIAVDIRGSAVGETGFAGRIVRAGA